MNTLAPLFRPRLKARLTLKLLQELFIQNFLFDIFLCAITLRFTNLRLIGAIFGKRLLWACASCLSFIFLFVYHIGKILNPPSQNQLSAAIALYIAACQEFEFAWLLLSAPSNKYCLTPASAETA